MSPVFYPRLIRRIRAVLVDSVLVPISVFGSLILGDALGVSHVYGKVLLALLPVFVLEPGLVAFTGGTVGHHLFKLRVARIDGQSNINIFAATLRFVVKLLLGWLSFIFVLTTTKHQAVHDLLARSVVVHKYPGELPAYEVLPERVLDSDSYAYPPAWRRVAVITGYWLIALVAISALGNVAVSDACMRVARCSTGEHLFLLALDIALLLTLGWVSVQGWRGLLFGCRRKHRGET